MTADRDQDALLDMLIAARRATRLAQGLTQTEFDHNEAVNVAVTHFVQIIGEAARKVSMERRESIKEIPWPQIVGMRHRVVHDYFNVKLPIVWNVLSNELPPLISILEGLLQPED